MKRMVWFFVVSLLFCASAEASQFPIIGAADTGNVNANKTLRSLPSSKVILSHVVIDTLAGGLRSYPGTRDSFAYVHIDTVNSDSASFTNRTTLGGVVNVTPASGTWNLANVTTTVDKDSATAAITSGTITGVTLNNSVIGASTPLAGTFTTLKAASTGNVLIQQTGGFTSAGLSAKMQLSGLDATAGTALTRWSNDADGPYLLFTKSRGTSFGSNAVVADGDDLGVIYFVGNDGTNNSASSKIMGEIDGTPGAGDLPGRMVFLTSPDGSVTPVERMRITNAGNVIIGSATAASWASLSPFQEIQGATPGIYLTDTDGANLDWSVLGNAGALEIRAETSNTLALSIAQTGAVTSGSTITGGGNIIAGTNYSFGWTGDANTYITNSSTDDISLITGGTAALVAKSGNVGIGTSNPGFSKVAVVGTGLSIGLVAADTTLNGKQLRVNNGATFSEMNAGDASFTVVSSSSIKENLQAVDTEEIVGAFKNISTYQYNYKASSMLNLSLLDSIKSDTTNTKFLALPKTQRDSIKAAKRKIVQDHFAQAINGAARKKIGPMAEDFYKVAVLLRSTQADSTKISGDDRIAALEIVAKYLLAKVDSLSSHP